MSEILALLNQGTSPLLMILIALILYFLNDLKSKINKVDQVDSLIFEIKALVQKLDGLIETQKVNKFETDEQMSELAREIKDTRDELREVQHRLVVLETIQKLKENPA